MQTEQSHPVASVPVDRRTADRLVYPPEWPQLRPVIEFRGELLEVWDISENGIRFSRPADGVPVSREPFVAQVILGGSESWAVIEGAVVRVTDEVVAAHLERGFEGRVIAHASEVLHQLTDDVEI